MEYSNMRKIRRETGPSKDAQWELVPVGERKEGSQCKRGRWQTVPSPWTWALTMSGCLTLSGTAISGVPRETHEWNGAVDAVCCHADGLLEFRYTPQEANDWLPMRKGVNWTQNSELRTVGWLHLEAVSVGVSHSKAEASWERNSSRKHFYSWLAVIMPHRTGLCWPLYQWQQRHTQNWISFFLCFLSFFYPSFSWLFFLLYMTMNIVSKFYWRFVTLSVPSFLSSFLLQYFTKVRLICLRCSTLLLNSVFFCFSIFPYPF